MYMLGEKRFTVYLVGSIVIFVYVIALLSTQKSSTRQGLALVPCYLLISFGTLCIHLLVELLNGFYAVYLSRLLLSCAVGI